MPTIKISHPEKFEEIRDQVGLRWYLHNELGLDTGGVFPNKDYFNIFYNGPIPKEVVEHLKSLEEDGAQIEYLPPINTD